MTSRDYLGEMFAGLWKGSRGGRSPYLDSAATFFAYALQRRDEAHAQLYQDLLVLFALNEKRDGYFVELGASDGIEFSNTYLLEKSYGWRGILAEPARVWADKLRSNRNASIDLRYVSSESGQTVEFAEASLPNLSTTPQLALVDAFNAGERVLGSTYRVETVSLNDLLAEHRAPRHIDYLSIDTEGSELAILSTFDFSRHHFGIITLEHNYRDAERTKMREILQAQGYTRVFEMMSAWDDWYIDSTLLKS